MSSDDYQVQNIYKYSRRTYKKNRRENDIQINSPREENIELAEPSPRSDIRSDGFPLDTPGCSCDLDTEEDMTNILHKKCPVISLAQHQLKRLLDDTDKLLCDNTRCCRSVYDFLCICKEILLRQNKCRCVLVALMAVVFFIGVLLGAASCGSTSGRFNSPILTCIDNLFIPDSYPTIKETFRCIA